ncbi:MAG: C10 family peptidase [Bacteroidales bacterium]|nr:C10 family peptidase [Bacteroidales bacterium]
MRKGWYLYVFFSFVCFLLSAKVVDLEVAKKVAKNIYYQKINNIKPLKYEEISLRHIYSEYFNNLPVYYVFSVEPKGFVIVSADDIAKPIIAYGFESDFSVFNMPSHLKSWMNNYKEQIVWARNNKIQATEEIKKQWEEYKSENIVLKKEKSQQPLLLTMWNQDWPYNELCPADPAGPGGHVYVGCVALSMAQVMKFYNHPRQGTGTHTNYSFLNGGYGNLTVNYGAQTYYWENMPNTGVNTTNNYEIAKLLYHCSVAVDMHYGPDGSGSTTSKIVTALKSFYYYASNCQYVKKSNYTDANWKNLLKNQIDNKMPMVYQGMTSEGDGHAWNCDGYNGDEFHMNWGWGGSSNGYYTLDNLTAGGYSFTTDQGAVINIYPANNYPQGCPTYTITGRAGSFNDGSGNQTYSKNLNCTYLIQPSCASSVTLTFDRFDLGSGDHVYIYDGPTTNHPLIADLTSSNPPSGNYSSTGDALLIKFTTDNVSESYGWYASYTTNTCSGTKTLTEPSGVISDGSKGCNYDNSKVCTWNIQPPGATFFNVNFSEFSFPSNDAGDNLKIYKENTSSSNLIGTYTGTNPPPTQMSITASKLIVKFISNSATTAGGFTMSYNAQTSVSSLKTDDYNIVISPNPFNNEIFLTLTLLDDSNITIEFFDILGKQINNCRVSLNKGRNSVALQNYLQKIKSGVILMKVTIDNSSLMYKIVKN